MIIRDLDLLEVTTEEVIGGGKYNWKEYAYAKCGCKPAPKKSYFTPVSVATADATSDAVGGVINIAETSTETVAAPGVASSSSSSKAVTIGEFGKH